MTENNIGKHLASEQSKEGHGNILRSDMHASNAEQSREEPDNGGMPGSASKRGMKRKLESKTLEKQYETILEIEKGQKAKTEVKPLPPISRVFERLATLDEFIVSEENSEKGMDILCKLRKTLIQTDAPKRLAAKQCTITNLM